MSRFDLAALPVWILAFIVLLPLAGLGYWTQQASVPRETFPTKLPDVEEETDEQEREALVMKDFGGLVFVRPREDKSVLEMAQDVLPEDMLGQVMSKLGTDSGDWHLVGIERQQGELVAILFYKDEVKSVTAGVGEVVHEHEVKTINPTQVTLMPEVGDQPVVLRLKEEKPNT